MTKPTVYILIGLPAAGKTTVARQLPKAYECSADEVRKEWFGDEGVQYTEAFLASHGVDTTGLSDLEKQRKAHPFVWAEVRQRGKEALLRGENIIVDGTNITRKVRTPWIETAGEQAIIHGIWINTPVDVCLERDNRRERHAGEDTIRRFAAHFQEPSMEEGFDILEIFDQNGELVSRKTAE